jgi:mitotic spindle assembly checkpoint protein MAD1
MGGGRHIPPGTRVVCLRDNPAQRWADTRAEVLERLKRENEALLRRLGEVEKRVGVGAGEMDVDSEEGGGKFVPRESYEGLKAEKQELEEVVKQKEKRLLRLQQVRQ